MNRSLFALAFLILLILTSCMKGSDARIGNLIGPSEMPENSTASFSISIEGGDILLSTGPSLRRLPGVRKASWRHCQIS